VFRDNGVSATKNKPEDRKGWQALMASPKRFEAVVIWKADRLARRTLDFLHTHEALEARGASIVAVEDPVDMTTPQGEMVTTVLASFAQMEAAAIRARVLDAQAKLLKEGRYIGGQLPYGYRKVQHPSGKGWAVAQDEAKIEVVREIVRRTEQGHTIYSTTQWLNEIGVPNPTWGGVPFALRTWRYGTVDSLVRHPLLAGMTPKPRGKEGNDGKRSYKHRSGEVVTGEDGLPVVSEALAVMSLPRWKALQEALKPGDKPQRQPKLARRKHSPLLSGLLVCGQTEIRKLDPETKQVVAILPHPEGVTMYRGTTGSTAKGVRPAYTCPECRAYISNAQDVIVAHVLEQRGNVVPMLPFEEVFDGGEVEYERATIRLAELTREFVTEKDPDRATEIMAEMNQLKAMQTEADSRPSERRVTYTSAERTISEEFEQARTDDERRAALDRVLAKVVVGKGKSGGWTDADKLSRLTFEWRDPHVWFDQEDELPDEETAERWAREEDRLARSLARKPAKV